MASNPACGQRRVHGEKLRRDVENPATDGPYPQSKELVAGYRLVDVDSLDRALEVAAKASAAPGPNGVPLQDTIEVPQVLGAPDPEM